LPTAQNTQGKSAGFVGGRGRIACDVNVLELSTTTTSSYSLFAFLNDLFRCSLDQSDLQNLLTISTNMVTTKLSNQVSLKALSRTPSGNVYHQDLKNIFSVLLFCLDLKSIPTKPSSSLLKFSLKKSSQPYTFTVENAIDTMSKLHIDLKYNSTSTVLSYEINSEFAFELLRVFYAAKLLHCPDDKTCKFLKSKKMILQPTPKGVAILHQFCLKMGISNVEALKMPEILHSNFNTMKLMEFERHSRTDNIIHNEHSDKLLFSRLMGPRMNMWSSKNGPEPISILDADLMMKPKFNNFSTFVNEEATLNDDEDKQHFSDVNPLEDSAAFLDYLRSRQKDTAETINQSDEEENVADIIAHSASDDISPFYHRFFTNPDSDSHVQYYVSTNGVRFFKAKCIKIDGYDKCVKNCFSGKAFIQCITDCTDLMYYKDALKIANNFVKWKLIESMSHDTNQNVFMPTKEALYVVSETGKDYVKWFVSKSVSPADIYLVMQPDDVSSSKSGEKDSSDLSLEKVLRDPGLKYLFRNFMVENMCGENLNVYDEITEFQRKIKILRKMVSLKDKEKKTYFEQIKSDKLFEILEQQQKSNALKHKKLTIYTAMNKLTEFCVSKVYIIFAMYVSEDAPNEINLDSRLRSEIRNYIHFEGIFDTKDVNLADIKSKISFEEPTLLLRNGVSSCEEADDVGHKEEHQALDDMLSNSLDHNDNPNVNKSETDKNMKIVKSHSNLALKLKHLRDVDVPQLSPTDVFFGPKLNFLDDMAVFYEEVKRKVFKMMETDSFAKFLNSEQFRENYTLAKRSLT
jgi:hypothetical protein